MAVFNEPIQWEHPLGNNADTSTLPDDAAATAGIASLQKLFQIINATPLEAGGIAPGREDVNALFKYLGDQIFYTQNGGVPSYNASYDYIPGRVVLYDNNFYKCIQANGVSSTVVTPDSNTAYWLRLDNYVRSVNGVNADAEGNVNVNVIRPVVDYSSGIDIAYRPTGSGAFPRVTIPQDGLIVLFGNSAYPVTEEAYVLLKIMNGDTVLFSQAANQPIYGNNQLFASVNLPVRKGQQVECAVTGNTSRICRLYPYVRE